MFIIIGPLGGVLLAAISSYVSKKNDETGEAVRGFGKTSLEVYNYLTKLNGKYEITDKISTTVSKQLDSLDVESDSVDKIKSAVSTTNF